MTQADGLYRVSTRYLCAGFVEEGRVTLCAPILRRNLSYWRTVAELQDTRSCATIVLATAPTTH